MREEREGKGRACLWEGIIQERMKDKNGEIEQMDREKVRVTDYRSRLLLSSSVGSPSAHRFSGRETFSSRNDSKLLKLH
jgi:hypothetical protein